MSYEGRILKSGGVGILATDTIYGVVGQALNKRAVERIYKLKKRSPAKPLIILINKLDDLTLFGINLDFRLMDYWPGPVSIVLPCKSDEFNYLHRGSNSLAFRWPAERSLLKLIEETGPLVAPSANPEGLAPAKGINEAKRYFGSRVDFYKAGKISNKPSKLIKIDDQKITILRP